MSNENINVFVSYSHADASLVAPVVKLLRVNKSLVFQDIDSIQPGRGWRSEIAKALVESHLVVVFWCDHASRSNEMSKEWKAAIEQAKDLLPILLDTTPLPPELAEFQWIDFRGTVGANHSSTDSSANVIQVSAPPPESAAPLKSARWLSLAGLTVAFAAVVVLSPFFLNAPQAPPPSPPTQPPEPTLTLPLPLLHAEAFDSVISILFLLGVVFAITVGLALLWRRRSKRGRPIDRARPHSGEVKRRIASELEVEILQRTASRRDSGA